MKQRVGLTIQDPPRVGMRKELTFILDTYCCSEQRIQSSIAADDLLFLVAISTPDSTTPESNEAMKRTIFYRPKASSRILLLFGEIDSKITQ